MFSFPSLSSLPCLRCRAFAPTWWYAGPVPSWSRSVAFSAVQWPTSLSEDESIILPDALMMHRCRCTKMSGTIIYGSLQAVVLRQVYSKIHLVTWLAMLIRIRMAPACGGSVAAEMKKKGPPIKNADLWRKVVLQRRHASTDCIKSALNY